MHSYLFSLYSIISPLWLNETHLERLSKVVQQLWNCSDINFYQEILNVHETTSIFVMTVIFLLHCIICALWSNETGLGRLSKVVQQVWDYSHINFCQYSFNFRGAMSIFIMKLLCHTQLFFSLYSIVSSLWLNETYLERLSKVVRKVWN